MYSVQVLKYGCSLPFTVFHSRDYNACLHFVQRRFKYRFRHPINGFYTSSFLVCGSDNMVFYSCGF